MKRREDKPGPSISGVLKEEGESPRPSLPRPRFLLVRPSPSPQNLERLCCARHRARGPWNRRQDPCGLGGASGTARWAGDHIVPVPEPRGGRDTSEAGWSHPDWGAPGGLSRVAGCRPSPLHSSVSPQPLPLGARVSTGEGAGERRAVSWLGSAVVSDLRVAAHALSRPECCGRGHGGALVLVLFAGSKPGRS